MAAFASGSTVVNNRMKLEGAIWFRANAAGAHSRFVFKSVRSMRQAKLPAFEAEMNADEAFARRELMLG